MYLGLLATCFAQMNRMVSKGLPLYLQDFSDSVAVDICITTDWKELEGVCMIADLLAKSEQYADFQCTVLTTY